MNIYNTEEVLDAIKLASKTNAPIILSGNVLRSEFKGGFVDVTLTEVLIDENFQIVLTKELQDWIKTIPDAAELISKREGKHVTLSAGTSKQVVDVCETAFTETLTPDFETSVKGTILAEGFRLSALAMKAAPSAKKERICFAKKSGCYYLYGENIELRWKTRVPIESPAEQEDADFICPLTPAQCSIAGKFCSLLSAVQIRPNQEGVILSSGTALIQLEWAETYGWQPPEELCARPTQNKDHSVAILNRKDAKQTFTLAERMSKYGLSFTITADQNCLVLDLECKTASGMFIANWEAPLEEPFKESRETHMKPHLALPLIKATTEESVYLILSENAFAPAYIGSTWTLLEIK